MTRFIRTKKTAGETLLYSFISVWENGKKDQKRISLCMKVDIKEWAKTFTAVDANNNPIQSETKLNNYLKKLGYLEKLHAIKMRLEICARRESIARRMLSML